jgi:hypothetical protein
MYRPETTMETEMEILEYRTMEKFQKPSNSECYTPSSEPYRIYFYQIHVQ